MFSLSLNERNYLYLQDFLCKVSPKQLCVNGCSNNHLDWQYLSIGEGSYAVYYYYFYYVCVSVTIYTKQHQGGTIFYSQGLP